MITNSNQNIVVGDNQNVNLQTYQQIYSDLTGKTESITKWSHNLHQIDFYDIQNLYEKMSQHLTQFTSARFLTDLKIYYYDDSVDSFSSFEKFSTLFANSNIGTERVVITFNILIIHATTHKPQNYKIEVNLESPIAEHKKERENDEPYYDFHYPFLGRLHGYTRIEYVDYNVAKTMMAIVNEWSKGLNQANKNNAIVFVQKYSRSIPETLRYFAVLIILATFYAKGNSILPSNLTDIQLLSLSTLLLYTTFFFTGLIGKSTAKAINSYCPLSYIKLNKADERLISETKTNNSKNIGKFFAGLAIDLFIGIAGSLITSYFLID
jgi:hypothetical protein